MDFVPSANRPAGQVSSRRTVTKVLPERRPSGRVTSTKLPTPSRDAAFGERPSKVMSATPSARRSSNVTRAVSSVDSKRVARPASPKVKSTSRPAAAKVTRPTRAVKPSAATEVVHPEPKEEKKPRGLKLFSLRREKKKEHKEPEDWNSKFVNRNVPKRPLAGRPVTSSVPTAPLAKKATPNQKLDASVGPMSLAQSQSPRSVGQSRALASRPTSRATSAPASLKSPASIKKPGSSTTRPASLSRSANTSGPHRSGFVYPSNIEKRPLSGANIYGKKPMVTRPMSGEEPKGPVTIISKPDKKSHTGIIVAVILTIILGAAAGTVAFLILPK